MPLEVEHVVDLPKERILAVLNTCFPGWGGERELAWVFERTCGNRVADVFVATVNGELAGLTALSYRQVLTPNGPARLMAIIGSSCTLPAFRGHGVFTAFVERTQARAREVGAHLYGAFVLKTNASYSRMLAAGCRDVPVAYGSCIPDRKVTGFAADYRFTRLDTKEAVGAFFQARSRPHMLANRFEYSLETWVNQTVNRPEPTQIYQVDRGNETLGYFLVGQWPDKLRMLEMWPVASRGWEDIVRALHAFAVQQANVVEWYVTDGDLQRLLVALPGRQLEGSLVVQVLSEGTSLRQREDRSPAATLVGESFNSWFLQSGDRI